MQDALNGVMVLLAGLVIYLMLFGCTSEFSNIKETVYCSCEPPVLAECDDFCLDKIVDREF